MGQLIKTAITHAKKYRNTKNMLRKRRQSQNPQKLHDSIYMKCPEEANPETESRLVVP